MENHHKEPTLAAVCGLYCGGCTLYIKTAAEDTEGIKKMAERFGTTPDKMRCLGCRSDTVTEFCSNCYFKKCAAEKSIDYCGACTDFPCDKLKEFQQAAPHRIELFDDMKVIMENGADKWIKSVNERYTCRKCLSMNSAYELKCAKCGAEPSNEYTEKHGDRIKSYFSKKD